MINTKERIEELYKQQEEGHTHERKGIDGKWHMDDSRVFIYNVEYRIAE